MNILTEQRIIERKHYLTKIIAELVNLDLPISYTNIGRYDYLNRNAQEITRAKLLAVPGNKAEGARQKFACLPGEIQAHKDARHSLMSKRITDIMKEFSLEATYDNIGVIHHLITQGHDITPATIANARRNDTKRQIAQYHYRDLKENLSSES